MRKIAKKGQIFDQLGALGIGVAVLAITLVVVFLIISQTRTQLTSLGVENGTAWNATETLGNAVAGIPGWVPLIIIAVIGSILLGLVALFRRR